MLSARRDELGEGPNWDPATQTVIRVDINAGLIHRMNLDGQQAEMIELEPPVSFALPRALGGLVVGQGNRILILDTEGLEETIASVDDEPELNRFNDAKCDAAGRLWAGTMSTVREPGVAALYRLDHGDELEAVVRGTTISNGLGWSPDNQAMFFIDSPTQHIDAFDYDLSSGEITARRVFVAIDEELGMPDGLTVDDEGGVWVSLFGGGAVHRYAPDGRLDAVCQLPTSYPTCPSFAGPDLDRLVVTTTQHKLTPEQARAEPLAGSVFEIEDPGTRGLPPNPFPR